MKIYNTLTKSKEDFVPIKENQVNMYVCGPTVYNYLHIGNMRSYVIFDVIRRFFEHKGFKVNYVQQFTDVDDKIINRSVEEGISSQAVADKYIAEAFVDYEYLGIRRALHHPRVTEEMESIINMISHLIDIGCAYQNGGSVFFETAKFKDYGKLSKKTVDVLLAGARVEVNSDKKQPTDFVLWKPSKAGEPDWESPWGRGRPGWHIECSAISDKYLDYLDIHGGGEDLIFPHHENEIAQSEALSGRPLAKYWLHNGLLTNNAKKMSKSLGNFHNVREISEKFSGNEIRFFLLSVHYRMPMEFSEDLLEASAKGLGRIKKCYDLLKELAESPAEAADLDRFKNKFAERMEDDFNTADAISVIFELVKYANTNMQKLSGGQAASLIDLLKTMTGLLGIDLDKSDNKQIDTEEIEGLIAKRQEARKNKDWAEADKIRDKLLDLGIQIEDTPQGVRWVLK